MALAGMLGEVTHARVAGLLQQRQPDILDETVPEQVARFEDRVRGAAVEVVLLTGSDPVAGPVRDLAVEAVAVQTASEIEYAEFPEQQEPGNIGRGFHLHRRYVELLARIREIVTAAGGVPADGGAGGVALGPAPVGSFPAALPWPDPVEVRWRWC